MYYVVIDLEWNQYHNPLWTPTSRSGVIMHEEIIQIGAVKTDKNMLPVDTFNIYVRLGGRRRLDRYVKKLTGIDERMLLSGEDFPVAADMFASWLSDVDAIFSWGQDDRRVFLNNLSFYGLDAPACAWYDAQKIYAFQNPQHGAMALKNIAQEAGIRVNLSLHNAMNDAILTSACMQKLDIAGGIHEYDKPRQLPPSGLPKPISSARTHRHDSQQGAWDEACASLMHCPRCMKAMTWEEGEKGTPEHFYKLADCPDHGRFVIKGEFLGVKIKTLKLSFYEADEAILSAIDKELAPAQPKKRSRRRKKKTDTVQVLSADEMLAKAIDFAAKKHMGQLLLPGSSPYIVHLMEVTQIVSTMSDDSALLSAAMLHDVLTMCPEVSADELRREFGDHVCDLVESMNDAEDAGSEQLMLRLADALSGLRSVKRQCDAAGDAFWKDMPGEAVTELKNQLKAVEKSCAALKGESAYQEYHRLVNAVTGKTAKKPRKAADTPAKV
ncbi:MAG: HD domain-containing protein [Clostridia bacterium]|nr:HD domain-containing protein [Clostridia bacterium]